MLLYALILQERNKLFLTRAVVLELVHAVKFRSTLPDANLQAVLQVHERVFVILLTFCSHGKF